MLTDPQLITAEMLLDAIDRLAENVQWMNDRGAILGLPPLAIRFQPSPLIHGENPYGAMVNRMMSEEYQRRIKVQIDAEHKRRSEQRERLAA